MATTATLSAAHRRNPLTPWALATYAVLIALALVAWAVSDLRMSGMDAGPGSSLGTFGFFITTWVVMMTAMMFPSVGPMVNMYASIQRNRRRRDMPIAAGATACFVLGYLLVWSAIGALAYLGVRLGGSSISWSHGGRWIAGAILFGAALYELTPLKQVCLRHCRSPLSFVLTSWRSGRAGALTMGVRHGAWCLGCCWALMAALFALGVMSLAWMSVIGALIAIEKLLPWRRIGVAVTTTVLLVLAVGVAFVPEHVPGLTVPGSGMSMMS
jgi:predicted metal-binding membrane protein